MPDTLDNWLEEWPLRGGWQCTRDEVQRLVDEIERLRGTSSFEAAYLAGQKALIGMLRVWLTQQDVTTVDQPHTVSHREYRPDADGP